MSYTGSGNDFEHSKSMSLSTRKKDADLDTFLLEKDIFSNIFEKDIKRVYLYKKAERLAKAMSLIVPALSSSAELASRADRLSVALVDAAILPPKSARESLARELLVLSSLISIARVRGLVSVMNADLILREARLLLDEVAGYEEPHIALSEVQTLPTLARLATSNSGHTQVAKRTVTTVHKGHKNESSDKGHIKDKNKKNGRAEAILSVLKQKGPVDIKAISTLIRDVSEKTIQRELTTLVAKGFVNRTGTRRWTAYSIP